jgi:hypothetical protein
MYHGAHHSNTMVRYGITSVTMVYLLSITMVQGCAAWYTPWYTMVKPWCNCDDLGCDGCHIANHGITMVHSCTTINHGYIIVSYYVGYP